MVLEVTYNYIVSAYLTLLYLSEVPASTWILLFFWRMNLLDEFTVFRHKIKKLRTCYQPNKGRYVKFFHVYVTCSSKFKIDNYKKQKTRTICILDEVYQDTGTRPLKPKLIQENQDEWDPYPNTILPFVFRPFYGLLHIGISTKSLKTILLYSILAIWPALVSFLDLITLTVLGEQ